MKSFLLRTRLTLQSSQVEEYRLLFLPCFERFHFAQSHAVITYVGTGVKPSKHGRHLDSLFWLTHELYVMRTPLAIPYSCDCAFST